MEAKEELQSTPEQSKKSVNETGHVKNAANFERLIALCEGFGTHYNPANDRLKIQQLHSLSQSVTTRINEVRVHKTNFDNVTNIRRAAFEDLRPFATRIINAFIVSGADKLTIEDAKAINKKIQGSATNRTDAPTSDSGHTTSGNTISTSQQSYDRKIDHLANLIEILSQSQVYNPNEEELKITSLQAKLVNLQEKNNNLSESHSRYSNALLHRNRELYNPETGLIQTAKEVKLYIKSVYGATSPEYNLVSRLEFKIRTEE